MVLHHRPAGLFLLAIIALSGWPGSSQAALKSKTNLPFNIAHYEDRVRQFTNEGHNRPVVILGDSRVEKADWGSLLTLTDFSNRGISSDTTTGTVARLAASMPDPVKLCVIQLGINDISRKTNNAEIVKNFRIILGFLEQKHAKVLLTSVVFMGKDPKNDSKNAQTKALNQMLERLADGTNVQWVDLNEKLAPSGTLEANFTVDNVHFTPEGYAQIAATLKPFIAP